MINKEIQPLVSVCIPTYNAGDYIEDTVISILNQTHQNLEIIIGDNASADNTEQIIKNLSKNDNRISYYKNDENIGFAENCNKVVSLAKSEFIALYHSDDIYEPTIIEEELKTLLENDSIAGVFTLYTRFSNNKKKLKQADYSFLRRLPYKKDFFYGNLSVFLPLILIYKNFFSCPTFMGRKHIYQNLGGFQKKYLLGADLDFWMIMLKNSHNLAIINKPLINYRIHEKQDSYKLRAYDRTNVHEFFRLMDDFISENNMQIKGKELKVYNAQKAIDLLDIAYNYYKKEDMGKSKKKIKESKSVYSFPFFLYEGLVQRFPGFIKKDRIWIMPFYYGGKALKKIIRILLNILSRKK